VAIVVTGAVAEVEVAVDLALDGKHPKRLLED
jgi:hypothetical protein